MGLDWWFEEWRIAASGYRVHWWDKIVDKRKKYKEAVIEEKQTESKRKTEKEIAMEQKKAEKQQMPLLVATQTSCFEIVEKILEVHLKAVEHIKEDGRYALRVLDIVLRQQAAKRDSLLVRQSFFHDDSRMLTSVGGGVSACRGLHSSFRPTQGGLSLNLDVSTTMILTPGPAKKMLRNMRVKATHSNREFKIKGLSEKPCNELYFTLKEIPGDTGSRGEVKPKEITVYEYFRRHLNLELRTSAYFPCIDVGKPSKPIYLPLAPGLPSAIYKITIFCANSLCVIGGNYNNGISDGSIGDISNLHVFNLACRYLSEFSSSFPDFSISHSGVLE
ncbi:hypothetical protein AgCh_011597 [Apium graveolens]